MPNTYAQDAFEFHVDPLAQGRVTPRALLEITGTISLPLFREFITNKTLILITRLAGAGWFFNIGYHNGRFIIQRNNGQIAIDEDWCAKNHPPDTMLVSWTLDSPSVGISG